MARSSDRAIRPGVVVGIAALGVAATTLATSLAAGAVAVTMARRIVTPPVNRDEDLRILSVSDATITLSVSEDSLTPGQYSLWFNRNTGHARVGEILDSTKDTVTRTLQNVDFGDITRARRARMSSWYFLRPRDLGYAYESVDVETPLGVAPAWYIPAAEESTRWVIQVHGRAVRRSETLRAVTVFRDAGYNSLLVSYRNDGDAPRTADNRYALGSSEWQDVEAAIQYAIDRGATNVVLMGWSMGGATVLQTATRSSLAGIIRGIVLDSPVIDWVSVLEHQGAVARVPGFIGRAAIRLLGEARGGVFTGLGEPIDLSMLDFVRRADDLRWPILLMHSDGDGYVPSAPSRALADARPDIVTFVPFDTALHVRLWNYDAVKWTAAIQSWLPRVDRTLTPAVAAV